METNEYTAPEEGDTDDTSSTPTGRRPLGFWLKLTDRQLSAAFAAEFESEGIDRRDWMLLNLLAGDVDDERLARFTERAAYRGSRRLDRLAARGWVTRSDQGWTLTDEGRAQRDALAGRVDAIRERVTSAISPEEYARLIGSLETIARELGWDGERMPRRPRGRDDRRGFGPGSERGGRRGFGPWFSRRFDHLRGASPYGDSDRGYRDFESESGDGEFGRGGFRRDGFGPGGFGPGGFGPGHRGHGHGHGHGHGGFAPAHRGHRDPYAREREYGHPHRECGYRPSGRPTPDQNVDVTYERGFAAGFAAASRSTPTD